MILILDSFLEILKKNYIEKINIYLIYLLNKGKIILILRILAKSLI